MYDNEFSILYKITKLKHVLHAECPHGRYGDNCAYECRCSGQPCNAETGQCVCGAGKTGDDCSQSECLPAFAAVSCALSVISIYMDVNCGNSQMSSELTSNVHGGRVLGKYGICLT